MQYARQRFERTTVFLESGDKGLRGGVDAPDTHLTLGAARHDER